MTMGQTATIEVKIKTIETHHTDEGNRLNQPLINVILECNLQGSPEKKEIAFSEMLSNLADMSPAELQQYVAAVIQNYVETAYKGQRVLDPNTGNWKYQDTYIGRTFIVEI